jgi:hypothetical protein
MVDVSHNLVVTQTASVFRHPQVPWINELDELLRLVIQPGVGVGRIRGRLPEFLVSGGNVSLLLAQEPRRIPAVAIGATKHDILLSFVHRFHATMTLKTPNALRVGLRLRLIDSVTRWYRRRWRDRLVNWNRSARAVAGGKGIFGGCVADGAKQKKQKNQTPNAERRTSNAELKTSRHALFRSAVRMLATNILMSSCVSFKQLGRVARRFEPLQTRQQTQPASRLAQFLETNS